MNANTCKPGQEQYEKYYSPNLRQWSVQYDYRTPDGKLYSCIAVSLELARIKRDNWLERQVEVQA